MVDRAARIAHSELNLDFYMVASGQEWRRPELAARPPAFHLLSRSIIPNWPKMPQEDDWEAGCTLDELRAWDWAPENPALLRDQGLEIALTTFGLHDKKGFSKEPS